MKYLAHFRTQTWSPPQPANAHIDHREATPVIAKHDFEDGDEVPGLFIAMGTVSREEFGFSGCR
jgi:hypothetical protein